MAAWAAALTGAGTSKSGWPMLRLTGSLRLRASSKTLRMPDDSMCRMRSATQRSGPCAMTVSSQQCRPSRKRKRRSAVHRLRFRLGRRFDAQFGDAAVEGAEADAQAPGGLALVRPAAQDALDVSLLEAAHRL